MTLSEIRVQEQRQRQVDAYCNMARSRHLMTYQDAVKTPPTWVCVLLAVVFVVGVVWQGGVCW